MGRAVREICKGICHRVIRETITKHSSLRDRYESRKVQETLSLWFHLAKAPGQHGKPWGGFVKSALKVKVVNGDHPV